MRTPKRTRLECHDEQRMHLSEKYNKKAIIELVYWEYVTF